MSLSDVQRRHIVEVRLANAEQMLVDASNMLDGGSLRSAANRCYYAVFYAASALAMRDNRTFHKHSGVISYFDAAYVKTGRLSKELGGIIRRAFDQRCETDYDDLVELRRDEVSETLQQARRFVAEVKSLLQTT
ncbi:MAG: HEPN domain-containing protein [Planctomycetes bacterium]|nr:HEPN domain-containing protein [Planctomycetota bacterium]MCG2685323.1 HEPN domain-containing protein [Planctomycetales bacterium]